jgi:hypothetical protein
VASAFDPKQFRHVRTSPAHVVYLGDEPISTGRATHFQGGKLTRREYENLRYQAGGWTSKSEYERVRHGHLHIKDGSRDVHEANAYQRWAYIWADEHGESPSTAMGADSDYSRAFAAAYRNKFADKSPSGPFSRLLAIVGLRSPDAPWDVGDSPKAS